MNYPARTLWLLIVIGSVPAVAETYHPSEPFAVEVATPVKDSGPVPIVKITKPQNLTIYHAHNTASPEDSMVGIPCLLDPADREIKLSGNLKAGQGVTVVVDGMYSASVHSLDKPILLSAIEPYNALKTSGWMNVTGGCGWHWIVAFPTAANGQHIEGTPAALSWFYSQNEHAADAKDVIQYKMTVPLLVVNWPLVGAFMHNLPEAGHQPGWIVPTFDRIPIDYLIVQSGTASCTTEFRFTGGNTSGDLHGTSGLIYARHVAEESDIEGSVRCEDSPSDSGFIGTLYAKQSGRPYKYDWPVFDGTNKPAPFDGVYRTNGSTGASPGPGPTCSKRSSGHICGTDSDCCSHSCRPDPKHAVSKKCD
jgi:hypothetical protein